MSEKVYLSIYSKGFPVTKDHGEFQLIVPNNQNKLNLGIESNLALSSNWPAFISGFYEISEDLASNHKCILFESNQAAIIKGFPVREVGKRANVIVLIGTIMLENRELNAKQLAALDNLVDYLIKQYSTILAKNDQYLIEQLKNGLFLKDRVFELNISQSENISWYSDLLEEKKKWENIKGFSDKDNIIGGANVLIGTEADIYNAGLQGLVDGFYDPISKAIFPINDKLKRVSIPVVDDDAFLALKKDVIEIKETLQGVQVTLQDIPNLIIETIHATLNNILFNAKKKKK
ncbi:hypothetical protein [Leptospira saintgironsiae]|uniref:Uncharacterized protein n=1 Tax=Leptospira saintgironsiae TaxID=2023183 RepID=A0A2M9Y800_9LEPT|nr:hypothetical protein [Leptospira saintgironsiae]PJZ47556.1 hypothetical protein CH362_18620 [Leptospira saintgironsiae]